MNKGLQKLFCELPDTYDLLNRLLTWRFDAGWRRQAANSACKSGGTRYLDICSGTADMAIELKRKAGQGSLVVALDFCIPMLKGAIGKPGADALRFVVADAAMLPFREDVFDAMTVSFAARNLHTHHNNLGRCFSAIRRVLRPGGVFINVETSQPQSSWLRAFFHLYVGLFVKPVGALISGSKLGYTYLSRTIPRFYGAQKLAEQIRLAGFSTVAFSKLLFGIAAIHCARK